MPGLHALPTVRRTRNSPRKATIPCWLALCVGETSGRIAVDDQSLRAASLSGRWNITSAQWAEGYGRRLTAARPGIPLLMGRFTAHQSARSRFQNRMLTSFTLAWAKAAFAAISCKATAFTNQPTQG